VDKKGGEKFLLFSLVDNHSLVVDELLIKM